MKTFIKLSNVEYNNDAVNYESCKVSFKLVNEETGKTSYGHYNFTNSPSYAEWQDNFYEATGLEEPEWPDNHDGKEAWYKALAKYKKDSSIYEKKYKKWQNNNVAGMMLWSFIFPEDEEYGALYGYSLKELEQYSEIDVDFIHERGCEEIIDFYDNLVESKAS